MIRKNDFIQLIAEANFKELFISELGWNRFRAQSELPTYTIDERDYKIMAIAERNGFQVLTCLVDDIPSNSTCRKLDGKLRRQANDYICIFMLAGTQHHLWVVPVKTNEKRELTFVEYENAQKADLLYSKVEGFSFELDEFTTIVDMRERVHGAFAVNSEKITKDFYAGFRKEHTAFIRFISGMDDDLPIKENRNKEWYTSVMLNRLMFCYFVQKKGFLNNDHNYLGNQLKRIKQLQGSGQYYSFYRGFLRHLFSDGLNLPKHTLEWERTYGKIPYLNGGMFDEHQLEREYPDIDIADEAFERLFAFFDKWEWHLDTRITASGKDINPDVLGYIFEQYINDRAAMGAYYTKEDITEYIGKNCILPFLMDRLAETDKAAFKPDGEVWTMLRHSGDRYIYDAVKDGYTTDWASRIPEDIAVGIDTSKPNLLERRKKWNVPTIEPWALPTEIWRETIERLQRCDMLLNTIKSGAITAINDFISYNLDIRSFVYDLLSKTHDQKMVLHFYHTLQQVTVLDPTCGSGAFLFAAMNILEPLYEVCIERMEEWNRENPNLFKFELAEISNKYRSNIQYFIYKSIILRNLYGVDIMVEATEIAKLRLFLKMVAVVEVDRTAPNMGLDPLPDIDFNIRCGNTLVGYATEAQLNDDLNRDTDILQMEANQQFKKKLVNELAIVATVYDRFKEVQFTQETDMAAFKAAKQELKARLTVLNDLLNKRLFGASGSGDYGEWLESHQPFHWMAEFYQIMHGNGGFDVIIGNPPYVEFPSKDVNYSFNTLISCNCGNLYGCCIERGLTISNDFGKFSFIIPVAITCSKRMNNVIDLLKSKASFITFANFDDRPGKLFEMIEHLRASIFIASKNVTEDCPAIYATKYNRWYSQNRFLLFQQLRYVEVSEFVDSFTIPKLSLPIECSINRKVLSLPTKVQSFYGTDKSYSVFFRAAGGGYFLLIKSEKSITIIDGVREDVKAEKPLPINRSFSNVSIGAMLSSSLFYWNYIAYTDCRNLTKSFIDNFSISKEIVTDKELIRIGQLLFDDYENNKYRKDTYYKTTGRNVIYYEYYPKKSKQIIDEIDNRIATHFSFTEEELDFIINFDIKYRMGDELNND